LKRPAEHLLTGIDEEQRAGGMKAPEEYGSAKNTTLRGILLQVTKPVF
jgi:hypothetical protein